ISIFFCSRLFRTHATRAEHPLRSSPHLPLPAAHPPEPAPPAAEQRGSQAANMSGAALCAALTELGFDGEDPLDADALEWPFQYEEARPLLAWICSCLRPSNVLSPSHLAQYEQLVEEGRLLEGEDLDSAFDSISAFSSKKDNQEAVFGSEETILDIREAKLAYRAEVFELQKQLARQQAHLDDITNCLIRGESEKSHHHQRVSELQRLRSIFATSERQWIEAQVENAKQQAILSMLKSQVSSDEAHIHRDIHSLRRKSSELAGELSTLSQKVQAFVSETIPCLCSELAQLQGTYILQGDYDLKVMRQEYYINRQKTFINHLVNQLARHQFLKIACQLERKYIASAYSLLRVIESELQSYLSAVNTRLGHYNSLIQAASEVREQGAIDDRDTFLHAVRDLLCIHSNVQATVPTYMSAHALVQQISALQSDLLSLQSELENTLPADRKRCINELCTLIQTVEQLLFASSTTAEPILTPWPLMRALDDMENANAQVEVSVEEVTKARTQKIKIFENRAHEVGRERQIFVDFFCNPERLKNQVRELTSRVKALQE
ncbi:hypothetical protein EJB05_45903, partial [Eragrostis curvula]